MRENFIIAKRYKSRDFMSFHFIFAVDYICDKNVLYSIAAGVIIISCEHYTATGTIIGGLANMSSSTKLNECTVYTVCIHT